MSKVDDQIVALQSELDAKDEEIARLRKGFAALDDLRISFDEMLREIRADRKLEAIRLYRELAMPPRER